MLRGFVSSLLLVACASEPAAPLGGARLLSVFPARAAATGWERVCDAGAFDGITADVVLGDAHTIAPDDVTLTLDCVAPVGAVCRAASARVDAVQAVGSAATRVMLLVDRSAPSEAIERAAGVVQAELAPDARAGVSAFGEGLFGRSNLWAAVGDAHAALEDEPGEAHIVVLSGGPDTCVSGETSPDCVAPCSSVSHAALMQQRANPSGAPVRLHFVQWLSAGHPEPDARQLNAACVSGGHHLTVPEAASPETTAARIRALVTGLDGTLRVAAEVGTLAAASSPPGEIYRLDGALTITRGVDEVPVPFGDTTPDVLRLVKPCAGASDCGGPTNACVLGCSRETGLCGHGAVLPALAPCPGGFCCDGECHGGGMCVSCADRR